MRRGYQVCERGNNLPIQLQNVPLLGLKTFNLCFKSRLLGFEGFIARFEPQLLVACFMSSLCEIRIENDETYTWLTAIALRRDRYSQLCRPILILAGDTRYPGDTRLQ